jgi:hypothetical protein
MIERRRLHLRLLVGACALCAFAPVAVRAEDRPPNSAQPVAAPLSLRLRIEWGGGPARRRQGSAEMVGGTLRDAAALGIEADEPGSIGVADGRLFIEPRSARAYDGVDVTVAGTADSRLLVTLTDVDTSISTRHEITLASLVDGTFNAALDAEENRLAVRRAPGDRLRVQLPYTSLVFGPGEVLQMQVEPHRLGIPANAAVRLSASLHPARQTKVLWSDAADLVVPPDDDAWAATALTIRLPDEEGVYDVVFELGRRDLTSRLRLQGAVERRKMQVVVLSTQPPPRKSDAEMPSQVVVEFDPASPGWWDRMLNMTSVSSLVPSLRRGPLGNVRTTTRVLGGTTYVELPATVGGEDPGWQGYPLPVARPGVPHVLEVEYPTDVAQTLGVSLFEPNAAGAVMPLGVDTGLFIDSLDVEPTSRKAVRRFIVWPRTASPLLVLVNRRRDGPAIFGKIRLLGPRASTIPYIPWPGDPHTTLPAARINEGRSDGRLLAAYYDRPLFPENFGATTALDDATDGGRRCLDDWVTFYDGARRMIDYLVHSGYNGLMLTVVADGSAIYPSRLLEPTPRYDDGQFFANGQDPLRKDVVEMVLRMCDREGLRCVPAVQFAAPLPRLEAARRTGSVDLAPLGLDGRSWNDLHATDGGLGPHYNPLHPRVQEEMTAVVAELVERYGAHPSLGGVAVNLSADGYTQLPGPEWGVDPQTLARFRTAARIADSKDAKPENFAVTVLDRHREAWLAWRKEELSGFYGRLQQQVSVGAASRKLYLNSVHAWERPDLRHRLQPSLPPRATFDETLGEMGLDAVRLAKQPGTVWMRSSREAPLDAPAPHGIGLELNRDDAFVRLTAEQSRSVSILFQEPQSLRLESLEKQSPFQPAYVRLVTQAAPAGAAARRSLVHQLATTDCLESFHGGWMLPLGEQDDVRRLAAILRALPAERFATVSGGPSHVVVRTLSRSDRTYVYVVNDAPWPTTVQIDVAAATGAAWRPFGEATKGLRSAQEGRPRLEATLEPYDVAGGMFLTAGVTCSSPRADVPPEVAQRLEKQIRELWAKCRGLQRPPSFTPPQNCNFEAEATAQEPLPGWEIDGVGIEARLDSQQPHEGRACALFATTQSEARLLGRTFAPPECGRLSLAVWLKSADDGQPPLRMAIEGRLAGRPYYRYASVGAGPNVPELAREWRQFVFQIHDLPTQGLSELRVAFELTGPGKVYLDDVRLSDLEFTNTERLELSKTISLAEYRLQRGEFGECARLLEGYWPRFLTKYVPTASGEVPLTARAVSPAPPSSRPAAPAGSESVPGMMERLRKRLPDLLR